MAGSTYNGRFSRNFRKNQKNRARRAGQAGRSRRPRRVEGVATLPRPDEAGVHDETGTATNMARRRGRCPRGEHLVATVPHGHWKTTTLVAGPRHDGITAPLVINRPMNGVIFKAYVEQMLAPTLSPGDIVIMDNLTSHKVSGVQEAVEALGAKVLYLPPYSPDLDPIEQAFAKLTALLGKAVEFTIESLWKKNRRTSRSLLAVRMPELLPIFRICVNLYRKFSRARSRSVSS